MKKYIFAALMLTPILSFAVEQTSSEAIDDEVKTFNNEQFCYYADNAFSEGAKYFVGDEVQICTRRGDSTLHWVRQ